MISEEEKMAVIDLYPFMGENPVVFDIGSNKGHWADVVLDEFDDKVSMHLFEPNQKLLSFCEIKYEYKKNIIYNALAVSNKSGKTESFFYFENFNNELSSLYRGGEEWDGLPMKERKVHTITIDEYCQKANIEKVDFIKIDCEGGDSDVLEGCRKLMSDNNVGIIQIEYSDHYKRSNKKFEDIVSICNATGYKIYRYIENNFWEVKEDNPPHDNYFITKFEIHNYSVGGWNNQFILNTSGLEKMDMVLEIGVFEGLTTKYICENLLNEGGRVIAVDPLFDYYYEGDNNAHPYFKDQYQRFLRNTRGLPVELKRGVAADELPKLHALRFNMCYIDGNHFHPHPYNDGCWAFAITKVGGYLLFDDYEWNESSKMSVDKFLEEFNGFYELIHKEYQVLIKKIANKYNELTQSYYL